MMSDKKKRIIQFDLWINDGVERVDNFWGVMVSGYPLSPHIIFETDGKDVMKDAFAALRQNMPGVDYSISYWSWISGIDTTGE